MGRSRTSVRNGLAVASLTVWAAILAATLSPFTTKPSNQVNWLVDKNGVHLGPRGMLISSQAFAPANRAVPRNDDQRSQGFSLEIWLEADSESRVNTILDFFNAKEPENFRLRQYNDSLIISHELAEKQSPARAGKIDVDHIFHPARPTLLSIASSKKGTLVYADGVLVESSSEFKLSEKDFSGDLIVGTFPQFCDPFGGNLLGLAIYGQELSAPEIQEHFKVWQSSGPAAAIDGENARAIYAFSEGSGGLVHNRIAGQPDLRIPDYFYLPTKPMLKNPVDEFTPDWNYVADILRNIAGFVPLGMVVYLFLSWSRFSQRAAFLTILVGGVTSLVIEILQAYIPQRYSGMTDILTNTTGTAVGVLLLQPAMVRRAMARIGVAPPPRAEGSKIEPPTAVRMS